MNNRGIHILADFYECDFDKISRLSKKIKQLFSSMIKDSGLTEVGSLYHFFDKINFTMITAISESHVAVHTWPEDHYVSAGIFVCNYSKNNEVSASRVYEDLLLLFSSKKAHRRIINR
ncbi:MAG: S-adenosylmethionine decarboxylase [Candidatus Paceibacterota bacterium]|jgi:S-adenosylmethionine decarboxylase proenzyme